MRVPSSPKAGRKQGLLFLKKKKQKDFCPFGTERATRSVFREQKFFASFFQKRSAVFLSFGLLLSGCATPAASDYVGGQSVGGSPIGTDASGERCLAQGRGAGALDVFCGTWEQPSAEAEASGPVPAGVSPSQAVMDVATRGAWRADLDARLDCGPPEATTVLGDVPAALLACRRRVGGWPQAALAAAVGGRLYVADGILPAGPLLGRAIGVLSGRIAPGAAPAQAGSATGAEALLARRLAAQPFSANDVGRYEALMLAGSRANLAESFPAAEGAFRAAIDIQRRAMGADTPAAAVPLALLALQLSDEGRSADAAALFDQAAALAPRSPDPLAVPAVRHYRALDAMNRRDWGAALPLLAGAHAGYAALVPPEAVGQGAIADGLRGHPLASAQPVGAAQPFAPPGGAMLVDPVARNALVGMVETDRNRAVALRALGRTEEAREAATAAADLARGAGLQQRLMTARLYRTLASARGRSDRDAALADLDASGRDFGLAVPGSRPVATTSLLRAAELLSQGRLADALDACRTGTALLGSLRQGLPLPLLQPCLRGFAQAARDAGPGHDQPLLAEMFATSELAQGGVTSQQIALATARLGAASRDPRVGAAIRRRQDAGEALAALERRREAPGSAAATAALEAQLRDARAAFRDADQSLQVAAPNYGQLVQEAVPASAVLAALRPGEAFVKLLPGAGGGWAFALRDGRITAAPLPTDEAAVAALVRRVRHGIEPDESTGAGPPPFDTAAARALYDATVAPVAPALTGARSLVVVPTGALLSLPMGVLLTGPADPAHLAAAPWLLRQAAIAHVPASANFVSLRAVAGTSRATHPWFGMGDARPVTPAQARAAFPGEGCAASARDLAALPPLPFAGRELGGAQALLGASTGDELLGPAFTVAAVEHAPLAQYRVIHFASHALLPTDLACLSQPAVVTSAAPGAASATGALLTAEAVTGLQLDADAVILSACNSGGPGGQSAGESLSGLARAFFYAGARSLMVTHWSVNDQAAAFLVVSTLKRLSDGAGIAEALRGAELGMLDAAGGAMPAALAHPFYWAPFALIGEGGERLVPTTAASAAPAGAPALAGSPHA